MKPFPRLNLSFLLLFGWLLVSSTNKPTDYSKVLPNTVKVNDSTYLEKTEVSNFAWLEYVNWNASKYGKYSEKYLNSLPDTNVWRQSLSYNEPYIKYYFRHPAYRDYPVVGVSWKQATDFCAWRSDRVHEYVILGKKTDKAPHYFEYRLPTAEEWAMMYNDLKGLSIIVQESESKKLKGSARWNMQRNPTDTVGVSLYILNDLADITAPVISYLPNIFGVYNVKGNVSEWVLTTNTHVGGSWATPHDADVSVPIEQVGTSAFVGFRCACEVVETQP